MTIFQSCNSIEIIPHCQWTHMHAYSWEVVRFACALHESSWQLMFESSCLLIQIMAVFVLFYIFSLKYTTYRAFTAPVESEHNVARPLQPPTDMGKHSPTIVAKSHHVSFVSACTTQEPFSIACPILTLPSLCFCHQLHFGAQQLHALRNTLVEHTRIQRQRCLQRQRPLGHVPLLPAGPRSQLV